MGTAATRRPTALATVAVLLAVSAVLIVANPRLAGASISWSAVNAPLPANAATGSGVTLLSASCPADGWCIAVGDYPAQTATTSYGAGLIDAESGGTWSALEAPLPPGASSSDPQALLESVSCVAVGTCVAVGRYLDSSGATQGLVEQLSNGAWSPSTALLPAGAATGGTTTYAELTKVSCPTSCTAVGVYTQSAGTEQALVEDDSSGSWSASTAPLPAPASGSQFTGLSCPVAGSCVAVGTYLVAGTYLGMIDAQSGATWSSTALSLPAGASPLASIANNDLSVSCQAPGSCAVAGTTFDGNYEGVLDSLSGGAQTAQAAPTPGGQPSDDVQLESVACAADGTCQAAGLATGNGVAQGLFESFASGTWSASPAPTPAGVSAGSAVEIHDVACPSPGNCVAVGQSDAAGTVNALFWNLAAGAWAVQAPPLPADAATSSDPTFAPVTCPAAGACLAVGTYLGGNGREGVVETDPSLAATATTTSMQSQSAAAVTYSAAVAGTATQPTGTVVFSSGLDVLCTAPLSNGAATCTGAAPTGATVVGSYSGDAGSAPSWGAVTNPVGPAAIVHVGSGWWQSTKVDKVFPYPMQALVTDAAGVGVPGVVVTFTVPSSGASAVLWGPATAVTNASGIATAPYMTADAKKGSYTATASVAGVAGTAPYYLTNLKG
jgi:hypothetical protein